MIRIVFALPPLLLLAMMPQDNAPDKPIPADAAAMVNPVQQPTPQALAKAKSTFGIDCALCHGATGNGKGDVVADLKLTMKDWTASPSPLDSMKDGELFYVIKNGQGKMPQEGDRAKDADLWTLVVYVRSLGKK